MFYSNVVFRDFRMKLD